MVVELNLVTGNHETMIHQSSLKSHLKEKPTFYLRKSNFPYNHILHGPVSKMTDIFSKKKRSQIMVG